MYHRDESKLVPKGLKKRSSKGRQARDYLAEHPDKYNDLKKYFQFLVT